MNYNCLIQDIFQSVEHAVGIHVTMLVVERALWKTKGKFEEAEYIAFSEEGICLDELISTAPERAGLVIQEFISCFVDTLGRLMGQQLASQLTGQLKENWSTRGFRVPYPRNA